LAQAALDLHETAGVRGDDRVGARAQDVRDLPLQNRAREVGLRDVIGPGAAAAPVRLLERDDLETGYRRKQRAWLLADLLTVQQMARIVPGDAPGERARRLAHPKVAEELGRVPDLRGKGRCAGRPRGIVLQKPA